MNELHITTVGISLLSNYCRETGVDQARAVRRHERLRDFLDQNPRKASAEINALLSRLGGDPGRLSNAAVALVYTQTIEGKLTAGLLKHWLAARGAKVVEIKLKHVQLPARKDAAARLVQRLAREGLLDLRRKVERHVKKSRKADPDLRVEFNVTGGYKAEVAMLYALGRELGLPVYYLHETFHTAIELP